MMQIQEDPAIHPDTEEVAVGKTLDDLANQTPEPRPHTSSRRVLIVGDAPLFMNLIEEQLRRYLIETQVVEQGHQVLTEVELDPPALIILVALCADRAVPSGPSLCSALKTQPTAAAIPLITILSATPTVPESSDVRHQLVQRSDAHFTLPTTPADIIKTIAPFVGLTAKDAGLEETARKPTRVLCTKDLWQEVQQEPLVEPTSPAEEAELAYLLRKREAELALVKEELRAIRQQTADQDRFLHEQQLVRCMWDLMFAKKQINELTRELEATRTAAADLVDQRQLSFLFEPEDEALDSSV